MIKKKLDERKILLVLVCKDKAESQNQIELLKNSNLSIPDGFQFAIHAVVGKKNLAASLNSLQKKDDSKYKFYLTTPVTYLDPAFIAETIEGFFIEPKTALVGLMGSEMPLNGDYRQARNFYGLYAYNDENGQMQHYLGKDALYYQSVHIVDDGFFATNEDIAWDEKIGDDFVIAAQCCNFRAKGYDVGVLYREKPIVIFERDEFDYNAKIEDKQLEKFFNLYWKKIQPLVSILIPTYNQPKFFQEALESALFQTYQNIEILVGDDSTDEDTKKLIKPYLKKYSHLKYFYHDGKIPRGGGANMAFLLNHCSGEFVNYLLHDDLFHPQKIYKMMQYYITDFDESIGLISSARDLVDANDKFIMRRNPWQPHGDAIISGREVGRKLLFLIANFIGELTTVLFRKKDIAVKNPRPAQYSFAAGNFCDIWSTSYGDMDTWLEILKSGKDMVFMSESLSVFRQHAKQNTFNPNTRITLPLDALNFLTLAWLNDVFFKNVDEYNYCLDKWPVMADRWYRPIEENDSDIIKQRKEWIIKIKKIFSSGDRKKMTDVAISYLLSSFSPWYRDVFHLIQKNAHTGLWEKNKLSCLDTSQIDSYIYNRWVPRGAIELSNAHSKFSKALQFLNPTSYLFCARNIELGGKDFTLECWAYFDKESTAGATPVSFETAFMDPALQPFLRLQRGTSDVARFIGIWDSGKFLDDDFCGTSPIIGKLSHIEVDYQHEGGNWKLFVNGNLENEKNNVFFPRTTFKFISMGRFCNPVLINRYFIGAISEIRVSDGICRHTENFTPSDKPHELDEYTIALVQG